MGMYTEFLVNCSLQTNTPEPIVNVLKFMVGKTTEVPQLPNHELFQTDRWKYMLTCSSYYFNPVTAHTFEYDKIKDAWCLISLSNFKNYNDEIELFLNWLLPYIDADEDEMIGYSRYEENKEPQIYYGIN